MSPRFAPILFGFLLSALMSLIVAGIAIIRNVGFTDDFVGLWLAAWLPSWLVAFPTVLVVAPIVRKLVGMLVKSPAKAN